MFGYSIKEVLEDNSMDIYMIMEALDTQKIHWYLKRKGSNKLTNACYAVRNPNCDNYLWFATFRDYLKGRKIIRNHKKEMAKLKKWLQEEIQNGNLTSTCVVTPDDRKNEDCCDYWGAGFAWYKNYGVEYNFCVDGEENDSAIYLIRYNQNINIFITKLISKKKTGRNGSWRKWEWFFSIIILKSVRARKVRKSIKMAERNPGHFVLYVFFHTIYKCK